MDIGHGTLWRQRTDVLTRRHPGSMDLADVESTKDCFTLLLCIVNRKWGGIYDVCDGMSNIMLKVWL